MKMAYLLVYDDGLGTRDQVKDYIEAMDMITTWRYDMPHSFYIISSATADSLAERLRELTGPKGKFLFVEFTGNEQGWITQESWYLINNKVRKPSK